MPRMLNSANAIEPFLELIIRPAGICLVANSHHNKSTDTKTPLHRIAGSHAYGAVPRNVHFRHPRPRRL